MSETIPKTPEPLIVKDMGRRLTLCVPTEWSSKSILEFALREAKPAGDAWRIVPGSRKDPSGCRRAAMAHVDVES